MAVMLFMVEIKLSYQEYGCCMCECFGTVAEKGNIKNSNSWRRISLLCLPNNVLNRVT